MILIPRFVFWEYLARFGYFVYGVIRSGPTCAIAAGVASFPFIPAGTFVTHWLRDCNLSRITMLPKGCLYRTS